MFMNLCMLWLYVEEEQSFICSWKLKSQILVFGTDFDKILEKPVGFYGLSGTNS